MCIVVVYINGILESDPFTPLDEFTQVLARSLHKAARNAFSHKTDNAANLVESYKIVGKMRNVMIRDACNANLGIYTHKQAREIFQCLIRKKKRSYLAKFGAHVYLCVVQCIGQLPTSSHQLEIEARKYEQIPLEERIFQSCHQGMESEERYACHCTIFMK